MSIDIPEIQPIRIEPNRTFMDKFLSINNKQKELVQVFLYESVKRCLFDTEKRIVDANHGRYLKIMTGKENINIPLSTPPEDILLTDEQILLNINSNDKEFYSPIFLTKVQYNPEFYTILAEYIDASRIEKIAILKFLEEQKIKMISETTQSDSDNLLISPK